MKRISIRRGFTLIELSIAIMLGMATGAMVLAISNQQLAFLKVFKTQSFLTDEAPIVSMHVGRLIGKAERFRLHNSVAAALSATSPVFADAKVILLNYRQPDGKTRAALLSFETRGGVKGLYYYLVPESGPLADPQWAITKSAKDITFAMENGVLRMTVTGPENERVIYSGTMQQ
jgi:hypothetical protein